MFESLDGVNIKNLSIENPKKKEKSFFDPEKELTEEMWQKIVAEINRLRGSKNWYFAYCMARAKVVFPSRFGEFKLSQDDWDMVRKRIDKEKKEGDNLTALRVASHAKILFPEHIREIQKLLPWNNVSVLMEDNNPWIMQNLKILYPEKTVSYSDGVQTELGADIQKSYRRKEWLILAEYLGVYKILFPGKKTGVKLNDEFWQGVKDELKRYSEKKEIRSFLYYAMCLKLIAAKEIKITDTSFEVIMPEEKPDFKEALPPMPQYKKFGKRS